MKITQKYLKVQMLPNRAHRYSPNILQMGLDTALPNTNKPPLLPSSSLPQPPWPWCGSSQHYQVNHSVPSPLTPTPLQPLSPPPPQATLPTPPWPTHPPPEALVRFCAQPTSSPPAPPLATPLKSPLTHQLKPWCGSCGQPTSPALLPPLRHPPRSRPPHAHQLKPWRRSCSQPTLQTPPPTFWQPP